jgi:hypothetical protein
MSIRSIPDLQAICFTGYPIPRSRHPLAEITSLEKRISIRLLFSVGTTEDVHPAVGPNPSTGGDRYGMPNQSAAE